MKLCIDDEFNYEKENILEKHGKEIWWNNWVIASR